MAADVFLPDLGGDGVGAALLPATVTGKGAPALLVFLRSGERDRALMRRITAVFSKDGGQVVQPLTAPGFSGAVFTPGWLPARKAWAAIGIRDFRLSEARSYLDPDNREKVRWRLDGALETLGLDETVFRPDILGTNRYGETVTSGPLGRSLTRRGITHGEWEQAPDGRLKGQIMGDAFFRGDTRANFSGSARGVAAMIARGDQFSRSRMQAMYEAITETVPDFRNKAGFRLSDLQEEIEGHLASMVPVASLRSGDPRSVVMRIDDAMAAHAERTGTRIVLQQYSTPFPIGRVAAETILPQPGERLLEPTVGNAVLVSGLIGRGLDITGIEMDAPRAARAESVLHGTQERVISDDYLSWSAGHTSSSFELVVANPPFGKLDNAVKQQDSFGRSITLKTLHHQIVFDALTHLDPNGRAFLVLPGDMMRNGTIEGVDRFFDNWLRSTYEVAGSASIDGRLYRKMGTEYPVILYAVGPRRERPLSAAEVDGLGPESHQLILSHDELFSWSDATQERMRELTGLRFVDYPEIRNGLNDEARASAPVTRPPQPEEPDDDDTARANARASGGVRPGVNPSGATTRRDSEPVVLEPAAPEQEPTRETGERAVPPATPPVPATTVLVDDIEDDPFVRRYEAFSQTGEATTQVQKSLQGLTYRALLDVETKHGQVDEYVAGKLGLTVDDLPGRLSAEQIDALALNFARHEEGRGFLNADLMGVGKGRFIAANIMAALNEGRPIIFMSERPNLFTDMLVRDIPDVMKRSIDDLRDHEVIRPFILNQTAEAKVRDPITDKIIFNVGDWKNAKENGIGVEHNMILTTYSQFQSGFGLPKLRALHAWMDAQAEKGLAPLIVLDEVHRAAGEESNTGERIETVVSHSEDIKGLLTYSSATPLKSGRNIKVFSPVLPDLGMSTSSLISLIESNPLALQEVLSSEMARMGTMISREVDSRGTVREFIPIEEIDPERYARIVESVDAAADILRELVEKSGEIAEQGRAMAGVASVQSGNAVSVTTTSPVSQFHAYSQYLMIAVKTAFAGEMITRAIAQGKKPVVVVENTGAEILSRFVERTGQTAIGGINATQVPRLPDIGDVLSENAAKMLTIKFTDSFGNSSEQYLEQHTAWLERLNDRIEDLRRNGLGELVIAPLDRLNTLCQERGLEFGELTKRGMETAVQDDGSYLVTPRSPQTVQSVVKAFNNGDLDVVCLNRTAASGVSLHASPATGDDMRPRTMIKLQLQSEVTFERQIDGRINRYGQVHDAEYQIPMTGFPVDDRLAQLFNRKNRSLSATSTATRENATNIEETVDLLNPVGEGTVKEYLKEHPELCLTLGLPIPGDDASDAVDSYARRLMGRMVVLPIARARGILSEIDTSYRMRLEALDATGQNPLRLNQFDWKAKSEIVNTLQAGDENAEAVGKRPVNLVRLTYSEQIVPITAERLDRLVERGRENMAKESGGVPVTPREVIGRLFTIEGDPDLSNRAFDKALARRRQDQSIGMKEVDPDEAINIWRTYRDQPVTAREKLDAWQKRVLREFDYAAFLDRHIDAVVPGQIVTVNRYFYPRVVDSSSLADKVSRDIEQETEGESVNVSLDGIPAVVTRVTMDQNDPLLLGRWTIGLAVPGAQSVEEVTLSSAYSSIADLTPEDRSKVPDSAFGFGGTILSRIAVIDGAARPDTGDITVHGAAADSPWFRYDAPHWKDYIHKLFETAPSGDIRRTAYALEGNMFLAMHLTTMGRGRLGQKAIYTTANGEIRHGVLLKKGENIAKLTAQIASRLDSMASAVPWDHPEMLASAIRCYAAAASAGLQPGYVRNGEFSISHFNAVNAGIDLVADLTRLLSKATDAPEVREYVTNNLTLIINDMRQAMGTTSVPELFVGTDIFAETDNAWKTFSHRRAATVERHKEIVSVESSVDKKAMAALASTVSGNDLHILLNQDALVIYSKKGQKVINATKEAGNENFLDQSSNKFTAGYGATTKLKAGALIWEGSPMGDYGGISQWLAATLLRVASEERSAVQARGGVSKVFSVLESHSEKALKATAEKRLDNDLDAGRGPQDDVF